MFIIQATGEEILFLVCSQSIVFMCMEKRKFNIKLGSFAFMEEMPYKHAYLVLETFPSHYLCPLPLSLVSSQVK